MGDEHENDLPLPEPMLEALLDEVVGADAPRFTRLRMRHRFTEYPRIARGLYDKEIAARSATTNERG